MAKNIIFCADGTWDAPSNETNVVKISRALLNDAQQIVFYDDGVGVDGDPIQKLLGGAFGEGLLGKVRDGYTKIAHVYEADDRIFLFGFSRGAYTARSLAGMIANCGLPTLPFDDGFIANAFAAYRNRQLLPAFLANGAKVGLVDAKIAMVGVWDTVGSLGIPAIFGGVEPAYQFLDTNLHPDVQNAFHAVSIDERRAEFPATLWTGALAPGQQISQVYFAGVHCDLGGGYPDSTLADIALAWMIEHAATIGARFDSDIQQGFQSLTPNHAMGEIHESWTPLWGIPKRRAIASNATLSNSVSMRCQADATYRPENLSLTAAGVPQASYQGADVL